MARGVVAAILVCAVMVIVALAPTVTGDEHVIVKGEGSPNASALSWEYLPTDFMLWSGHIVNDGLRSLVVTVYDSTTGALVEIMHQKIRFAAYGIYPRGEMDTNSAVMSPTHRYLITAVPNGPKGTSCTLTDPIVYPSPPFPVFTSVANEFPRAVILDASGSYDRDGVIVAYDWTFGDGNVDSGVYVVHTYAAAGIYVITLTVTDDDGYTATMSQTVDIGDPPVASFTYSTHCLDVTVDASGSYDPDGTIVSYEWQFEDGFTATGITASHTFANVEPFEYYWIGLWVTDNDGITSMIKQEVLIFDGDPGAVFALTISGYTVSVDASGSWDDDGIVGYFWNWGDGTSSTNMIDAHTYSALGTYAIELTVTDTIGQTGTSKRYAVVPPLPIAAFSYTLDGSTVYVDASGSSSDVGIASFDWDWGDGTTGSGMTASHTYAQSGPTSAPISSDMISSIGFALFGYVYLPDGVTPAVGAEVTAVNLMSGYSETLTTDDYGSYGTGMIEDPGGPPDSGGPDVGDVINVTAVLGTMIGWNEGTVTVDPPYLWLDIDLVGQGYLVTLTVTDTIGRTSTAFEWIQFGT